MKNLLARLFFGAAVLSAALAHAAPQKSKDAQQKAQDAHVRAVRDMLAAVKFDVMVRTVLDNNNAAQAGHSQAMKHLAAHASRDEVLDRFAPLFAPHIDTAGARQVSAAPASPAAKALFAAAQKGARPAGLKLIGAWSGEHHDKLLSGAIDEARAQTLRIAVAAQKGVDPVLALPAPTGVAYIDEISRVALEGAVRTHKPAARLVREFAALGVTTMMSAEHLLTPEGIAKGRKMLLRVRELHALSMRDMRQSQALTVEGFKKIDFAAGSSNGDVLLKRILAGFAAEALVLDQTEARSQAMFDIEERLFAFAEERAGRMGTRNGQLMFKEAADLAEYNRLFNELQQAMAVLNNAAAAAAAALRP